MKKTILLLFFILSCFQILQAQDVTLIAKNSSWKYYQAGNQPIGEWASSGYDDAGWSSGNAILAWGVIDAAPTTTTLITNIHTIYFRKTFTCTKTGSETQLQLNYLFDDGAVVYLNGVEITRINMPSGTVAYSTWTSVVGNEGSYTLVTLPPAALTALVNGTNVLAVEVHNTSSGSSDLGLDCSLTVSSTATAAACKHIRFGSSDSPLNGLTITWRNTGPADRIKWGYTNTYERGESAGTKRTNYTDNQFDYIFPSPVTPNSTIYYQLYDSQAGLWTTGKTYKTASDISMNKFNFTSMGDSRTNLTDWQTIANAAAVNSSDFVLFGGDITNSGSGVDYDSWFDYGSNLIGTHLIYHTIGNHELTSDPQLVNFKSVYTLPGNEEYYSFKHGNALFMVINSENPADAGQLSWLQTTLAANGSMTWKIVMFHRPFFTSPSHIGEMDAYFGTIWKAFDDYGVDMILNGHTHNYQRSKPINRSVSTTAPVAEYGSNPGQGRCEVVAGAAGAPLNGVATPQWWLESTANEYHYCNVAIDGNTLSFKAYRSDQTIIDQFAITKSQATIPVTSVSVNPSTLSLVAGSTGLLTATVLPSNSTNKSVTWSTGNASVATVNSAGIVTAVAAGTANITATTVDGGFTATTSVSVIAPPPAANYSPTSAAILQGSSGSGSYANLETNNSGYYVVNSKTTKPYNCDWYGSFTISQNPSQVIRFTVTYDGKYSRALNQILYLHNFITNSWVQIDSRSVSTKDVTVTYIQNSPANFISSTGEIRVRVYASFNSKSFTCSDDFMQIKVETSALKSAKIISPLSMAISGKEEFKVFPNPAKTNVTFQVELLSASMVDLAIFDIRGAKVVQIREKEKLQKGTSEIMLDTKCLKPGIYFCNLKATDESNHVYTKIAKLIILN